MTLLIERPSRSGRLAPLAVSGLSLAFLLMTGCASESPVAAPEAPEEVASLDAREITESVRSSLDPEADPCQDFYRYACGGWVDTTELPGDQPRWGRSFSTIQESNRETLKKVVEGAVADSGGDHNQALVGAFYGACMNEEAIAEKGIAPLAPFLEEIQGADSLEALMTAAGHLHRLGVNVFFEPIVLPDFKDPTRYLTYYSQGGLGLPERDFYLRDDEKSVQVREDYEAHIGRMLTLSGGDADRSASTAKDLVALETKLAEASRPAVEMRDLPALYNKVDLSGLEKLAPTVNWKAYQDATGFSNVEDLVLTVPEFFEELGKQLEGTDLSLLQDYLHWHLVRATARTLTVELEQESFDFNGRVLNGTEEMEPRWKRCTDATDGAVGEALGSLFVERRFPGDSKEIAVEMIRQVEAAFEENLPSLEWMDDATRGRAVEKIHAVTNKIGYPDAWKDYSSLNLDAKNNFANALAVTEFEFDRVHGRAGGAVDRGEWNMTPPTVNAYYNPTQNEIVFPAGILQPPVFHRDFPAALSFGAMGAVVGHELTHGFDDAGRRFDATGELREWWEPEVSERFDERATCVADLYDSYEVAPGLNVNGRLTLGENIADLGGVKAAYNGYRGVIGDDLKAESPVPGLTNEQLFFVGYSQVWCALSTPEFNRLQVQSDPHSPPKFRVNGPLSNLPAFAEAFSCSDGAPMKRENACEVW